MNNPTLENLIETTVTYTLEMNGQFFLIENVPARVNRDTGEEYFSPDTVEKIQQIINDQRQPSYFIQTPVYNFL
ncbi:MULTISPECIES: YgiT-type zinc finger protein [Spirulina sp. CCY15215]|uniref:YgiT-type zinc finger protein n=1 Tax=Spirulina sp. CCY15215 TaxID=2767591 RepID=UPI0019504C82|nr:YgiT-type zinc finger protein [Spirulina major]